MQSRTDPNRALQGHMHEAPPLSLNGSLDVRRWVVEALLVDVAASAARSRQAEQLRQCSQTLSRQADQLRQCSQTLRYAAAIHGGQALV